MSQKTILILIITSLFNLSYGINTNSKTKQNTKQDIAEEKKGKEKVDYYRTKMYKSNNIHMLNYADSLVTAALKSKDNKLIGEAYLTKGIAYYNDKKLQKALDNYLIADQYIATTNEEYTIHKIKYTIGQTKYYLGFYHEAISLFKECLKYYETENDRALLNTIHAIGICFNKIQNFDSCTYYNNLGLKLSRELKNNEMVTYFDHSEAINIFCKKNFKNAITKLNQVIPSLQKRNDYANETVAYFYLGKSHLELNDQKKAIEYFLKVDKAFIEKQYLRPDLRENFELLLNYYKNEKNAKLQLVYINRLLTVDSILNQNYKYLSQKIFKEYDTKKLTEEKEKIENQLKSSTKISWLFSASLGCAIIILILIQNRNKRNYKAKFDELMSNSSKSQKSNQIKSDAEIDINPEIVVAVIKNLEKFEKNKKFLEKDMNLVKLASILKTNTKYASKIIYQYRGKRSIEYISDLKIDYVIELLKKEKKYRNYTNKALAEEIGFGSTQNFTKAFNNRTGISPTYFISELNKKDCFS